MKFQESGSFGNGLVIANVIARSLSLPISVRRLRWIASSPRAGSPNTTDLLDLLNVLGRLIALEPAQADLLERICAAHLITKEELEQAGALLAPDAKTDAAKSKVKTKTKAKQSAGD
jgi:hypothetical protein